MMHQLEKPLSHDPQLHTIDKPTTPIGGMSQVGPIERRNRQQRADWMRSAVLRCGPFTVLDEEALDDLIKVSSPAKFARRGLLYEQGSVADSVYVVASGRVRVVRAAGESRTLTVAYRVAGELLGETALPDGSRYRATATATEPVEAVRLPMQSVQRLLTDRSTFEGMFERLGEPQPRYYRYTLNALVGAAGVPEGMRRDVFCIRDTDRPLHSDNLLHVELSKLDASTRLLCAETLLPAAIVEERQGYLDEARERLMQTLSELVPFVGEHLVALDSPHDGRKPWTREPGVELHADPHERRGPHTMPVVHAFPVSTALGVCAMSVKTPLRGLLLCNQQVAPGLGMEGQLLAAASAAHVVRRGDRGREWLRRRLWTKVEM